MELVDCNKHNHSMHDVHSATSLTSAVTSGSDSSDSARKDDRNFLKRKYVTEKEATGTKLIKTVATDECSSSSSAVTVLPSESTGPYKVQNSVKLLIQTWGAVLPVHPDYFLQTMLSSRGYETASLPSLQIRKRNPPSVKQIMDYDNELVWSIRNSDLPKIKFLWSSGRSMSACNRYCESIVHMACRRAELEVVEFILTHGGDIDLVDDYGRTPLHDACWRIVPRFDVVTLLMDRNIDLIRCTDARGSTPLKYCREEHWREWCAYLFHQREKYWAPMPGSEETARAYYTATSIADTALGKPPAAETGTSSAVYPQSVAIGATASSVVRNSESIGGLSSNGTRSESGVQNSTIAAAV